MLHKLNPVLVLFGHGHEFLSDIRKMHFGQDQQEIIQKVREALGKYEPRLSEINQKVSTLLYN